MRDSAKCQLSTARAVYFSALELDDLSLEMMNNRLLKVQSCGGSECWLNPAAVHTVWVLDE